MISSQRAHPPYFTLLPLNYKWRLVLKKKSVELKKNGSGNICPLAKKVRKCLGVFSPLFPSFSKFWWVVLDLHPPVPLPSGLSIVWPAGFGAATNVVRNRRRREEGRGAGGRHAVQDLLHQPEQLCSPGLRAPVHLLRMWCVAGLASVLVNISMIGWKLPVFIFFAIYLWLFPQPQRSRIGWGLIGWLLRAILFFQKVSVCLEFARLYANTTVVQSRMSAWSPVLGILSDDFHFVQINNILWCVYVCP